LAGFVFGCAVDKASSVVLEFCLQFFIAFPKAVEAARLSVRPTTAITIAHQHHQQQQQQQQQFVIVYGILVIGLFLMCPTTDICELVSCGRFCKKRKVISVWAQLKGDLPIELSLYHLSSIFI